MPRPPRSGAGPGGPLLGTLMLSPSGAERTATPGTPDTSATGAAAVAVEPPPLKRARSALVNVRTAGAFTIPTLPVCTVGARLVPEIGVVRVDRFASGAIMFGGVKSAP